MERFVTEMDNYLFGKGTHYEIYEKLGAHPIRRKGKRGIHFAVWAPNAKAVSVIGEMNGWNPKDSAMVKTGEAGIWELFIPGAKLGQLYKYQILGADGNIYDKSDPFAFSSELRPGKASKVASIENYRWGDDDWQIEKCRDNPLEKPMAIYEVHLGSWKKDYQDENDKDGFYDYRRAARELASYVKDMGYTHVELMGIAEHPFDGSWGYQVTGYYAPTSRYGEPKDFMYLVDYLHRHGIGVILDWVPAHFPKDANGLAWFDGAPLYENPDSVMGEQPDWGTKIFHFARNEVKNFLIANALYWIEKYHVDGLRVDAVAAMLYLDYGRGNGGWKPNKYGGHENLDTIEFFHHLGSIVRQRDPGALLIAEESTAWPKVTAPSEDGGLGFHLKWNMGWMNDFLEYVKLDPYFKKDNHNKMTFSMTYAYSENYILVISHDEVVHLKCSMASKMPGYPNDKLENLKTAYTYMIGHPGRKLLFMGQEFGQLREWSEERSLDWYLLDETGHKEVQQYVKKLLHLYKESPALCCETKGYEAFEWINANDNEHSVFSFIRKDGVDEKNSLIFICNFTPMEWKQHSIGVPKAGVYRKVLSSKTEEPEKWKARKEESDGKPYRLLIDLKPFESLVLKFPTVRKKKNAEKK